MRTVASLVAAFVILVVALPSAAADKDKLRSAAKLPRVTVLFGLGFNTWNGVCLTGDDAIARVEAAALEKTLKGDASDADRLDKLGILYERAGDNKKAEEVSARAVVLYRKQLEAQPDNPHLLAQLGHALEGAGESEQAEKVLRRTVQLAPSEWLGWLNLGARLEGQVYSQVFGQHGNAQNFAALIGEIASGKVPIERVTTARKSLEEASACFDKAVALAPGESSVYAQRAFCRSSLAFLDGCKDAAAGKPINPLMALFSPEAIPDLVQAVRFDPENYRLRGLLLWYEVLPAAFAQGPGSGDKDGFWNALPEKERASAREQVAWLEALTTGKDTAAAAGACEILGTLELVVHRDPGKSGEWFHRAVKLAPSHEAAWDFLAGAMAGTDVTGLVRVSEERVQYQDNAKNRFLTAKAYEAANQLDKAQEAIETALQRDPKYFPARLGLAALVLRRNNDAASRDRAGKLLDELAADEANQPLPDRQGYALTRAIYLGLCDKQAEALPLVRRLVEEKCAYDSLQTVLDALAAEAPSP